MLLQRAATRGMLGRSMLFRGPERVLEARTPAEVREVFAGIESMLAEGFALAGYIAYEAGFALEPGLADLAASPPDEEPLVWLGCYQNPEIREEPLACPAPMGTIAPNALRYSLTPDAYQRHVEKVRELIAGGETYQANLTMDVEWDAEESPAELYRRLLEAQPVRYAALVHPRRDWHVLSLSPELFFAREGNHIHTKPMKGTAPAGRDGPENDAQAARLQESEKERAENVMIVDLLRNDLGRICETGSVEVTKLFEVERYPTVLQMTSTVGGQLREQVRYAEVFGALFPSGSIVGAPKIHTMRLLHGLEQRPRGVYTGAIGFIAPEGRAEFNVAIRTVSLRGGVARMGVGSGITFDSDPALEHEECLTKTRFLEGGSEPEFELIETLLLEAGRFSFLQEHLRRMAESAEYFGFAFDDERARMALRQVAQRQDGRVRVRLVLNRAGAVTCTTSELEDREGAAVSLLLREEKVCADDRFLRHKTTHRALYDGALREVQARGFADCLFRNTQEEVTEGAIHNVIARIAGEWITPPQKSGVLPGVYRRHLLQEGKVVERVLRLDDLLRAEAISICNSVRGMRWVARLVAAGADGSGEETVWTDRQDG